MKEKIEKAPESDESSETGENVTKLEKAEALLKKRVMYAAGIGLVPVAFFDLVALIGIQLEMLKSLSNIYDVQFEEDFGKSIITSLIGSALPVTMTPVVASVIKMIPLIGQTTGALTMSILGGASTYAIGKVFIKHFETGGTFIDFKTEEVKGYFREMYEEGKKVVSNITPEK